MELNLKSFVFLFNSHVAILSFFLVKESISGDMDRVAELGI